MDYTFIYENYVWIIVVAVILVMTIVGYIADKTNFGEKKPKKEKISKKEMITEQPIQEDASDMETLDEPINFTNELPVEESFSMETLEIPEEQSISEDFPQVSMEESFNEQPVEEINSEEDVSTMPLDDFEMPTDDVQETNNESDGFEQYKEDTTEINEEKIEPVEPENFELPNIEQLNQEIAEVEEDEDVWKF